MAARASTSRLILAAFWPLLAAAVIYTRVEPLTTIAGLTLLAYFPGRICGEIAGIGRQWDRTGRFILSVALSFGIMPLILNPIWHLTNRGMPLLCVVAPLVSIASLCMAWLKSPASQPEAHTTSCFERRSSKIVFIGCAALVVFAVIGPYWPTELYGFPMPSMIHDFIKHHAVLSSLEKQPLPLGNPFYADAAAGPVYYYHFFYLFPATLRAWSGSLSIELAFGLCSALLGVAITGLFYLLVKKIAGGEGPAVLAVLLATVIGGLDVLPLLYLHQPVISLDAWADHPVRIHSLLTQMVWSPQNMLGVLVMLVGVYTLSCKGWWRGWPILGPLLSAATFGSSPWIAMAIFPGLVFFVLYELWRRRVQSRAFFQSFAGALAVALLTGALTLPTVLGYAEMSRRLGKSLTFEWPHHGNAFFGKLVPPGPLANLLDLPWILALELGPLLLFPLFLPRRIWRRIWDDAGLRLLLISACVAIAGYATVRSHFTYNDFGQKIMLVAISAGVVLSALLIDPKTSPISWLNPCGWTLIDQTPQRRRRGLAWFVGVVLLLGAPLGFFQSPLLAARRYLAQLPTLRGLSAPVLKRAAFEGDAGRFVRYELPPDAVLQGDVTTDRLELAQISRKQIGVTILERDTMVFSPHDVALHERTLAEVRRVLEEAVGAEECHAVLKTHNVTHVYVGELEREGWRGLDKFEQPLYFRCVFRDDAVAIYALE